MAVKWGGGDRETLPDLGLRFGENGGVGDAYEDLAEVK